MAVEVKMPQLGLTMTEGTVGAWLKKVGEPVKKGEAILEITTDKLTSQIESEADGVLLEIFANEGDDIPVQGRLCLIGQPGEAPAVKEAASIPAVQQAAFGKEAQKEQNVLVIGGGPGGYVAAIRAAQLGGKVTLVEKEYLGGTCLNVGCIPTKALLHTAELYEEAKNGSDCGVIAEVRVDFQKAQEKKRLVTKQLVSGVKGLLAVNKVKVIEGTATLMDNKTVHVEKNKGGSEELTFDKLILATGSVPVKPPIPGIGSKQCIDSTGALSLEEVPKTLVIMGGGVIGVELATLYAGLGAKVHIVEMMDALLPMMDGELTKMVCKKLEKQGVTILTGTKVTKVTDNGKEASVEMETADGKTKILACEKLLVSVGRRTNTEGLGLEKAGIANDRGRITVNDKMETNVPNIYAIGDCNGRIMLAHVASAQGEVAAENALGHSAQFESRTNPSCVYTSPEFAGVGLTEEKAKADGIEYIVGKFPLSANGKALIMNGGEGVVKFIIGKEYHEVLGVHILGPRATDLITEAALAIGMEATVEDIIATIHAHPTVGEAMGEAAMATLKRAIHIPNK